MVAELLHLHLYTCTFREETESAGPYQRLFQYFNDRSEDDSKELYFPIESDKGTIAYNGEILFLVKIFSLSRTRDRLNAQLQSSNDYYPKSRSNVPGMQRKVLLISVIRILITIVDGF